MHFLSILSDPHFKILLHEAKCVICLHDFRKAGKTAPIAFLSNVGTIQLHYWMVSSGDCEKTMWKKEVIFLISLYATKGKMFYSVNEKACV